MTQDRKRRSVLKRVGVVIEGETKTLAVENTMRAVVVWVGQDEPESRIDILGRSPGLMRGAEQRSFGEGHCPRLVQAWHVHGVSVEMHGVSVEMYGVSVESLTPALHPREPQLIVEQRHGPPARLLPQHPLVAVGIRSEEAQYPLARENVLGVVASEDVDGLSVRECNGSTCGQHTRRTCMSAMCKR